MYSKPIPGQLYTLTDFQGSDNTPGDWAWVWDGNESWCKVFFDEPILCVRAATNEESKMTFSGAGKLIAASVFLCNEIVLVIEDVRTVPYTAASS